MNKDETVQAIIEECYKQDLSIPEQIAYILATVEHETDNKFEPIHEYGTAEYFNRRYGPRTAIGKRLGNIHDGDGAKFAGRGYVQLTGRANYYKYGKKLGIPLLAQPELAQTHEVAKFILVDGFRTGMFTGKKLEDYINAKGVNFYGARRCINGTDRARHIAMLADAWLKRLQDE